MNPSLSPSPSEGSPTGGVRFETTHWSVVLKAGRGAEEALVKLCRTYWLPLYAYTRRRGHAFHEAQDLTQAFFAHLLENQAFAGVAPSKGRFRSFLLISLKHFLDNEWHKTHALKRGGQRVLVSWDELKTDERESLEPCDHLSPERIFNRRWALMLLERVMDQLRNECIAAQKGDVFEKLKDYLTGDPPVRPYREIAGELGMSEGAVKVTVHRLRRRFGELVRGQIERTVASPDEIDDEIRQLFAALS
jgi:RNA polymerase sigma factor (sigma-70 family)